MKKLHPSALEIDGALGEGGGQVLRSSLALSLITGRPFRAFNIRAGRARPGLMRQHLTAVQAAARIGSARVEGASIGSTELTFSPGDVRAGDYDFSVGTAGSATLVLQTVLPALLTADAPSSLALEGGTHNPWAPPFDFLDRAFLPVVCKMGPKIEADLERPGFYPAGGGRFRVSVEPVAALKPIHLLERGAVRAIRATASVARIPRAIAERELKSIGANLSIPAESMRVVEVADSRGPGNVVTIEIESERVTEVFTGFGEHRRRAESVAETVTEEARRYLAAEVAVGPHLADQLLLPMALAGGGAFTSLPPTRHATTNVEVIRRFLEIEIAIEKLDGGKWRFDVGPAKSPGEGRRSPA
jgi:RNA 3'-terminal phosphate cyclase (ATP)